MPHDCVRMPHSGISFYLLLQVTTAIWSMPNKGIDLIKYIKNKKVEDTVRSESLTVLAAGIFSRT